MKTNSEFVVLHSLAKFFGSVEVATEGKSAVAPMQLLTDNESARIAGSTDPEGEVGNGSTPP